MVMSCAIARYRLARRVAELRANSSVEKVTTAAKAGYVGTVATLGRAVAGNASFGGLRTLALQPLESGFDYLESLGKHLASGGKVPTHEFRQTANALRGEGLGVLVDGFGKGLRPTREAYRAARSADGPITHRVARFVEELRDRLEAENVADILEVEAVTYKNPVAQTIVHGAFALLEAADRPFWRAAFDSSLHMQSRLMAIREGLTGKRITERARHYFENQTDEMLARATADANYATFKDRNLARDLAAGVKRSVAKRADTAPEPGADRYKRGGQRGVQLGAKYAQYLLDVNLPFTGVPSSIAYKIGSLSPLGVLSPNLFAGQAQRARVLASAAVGTAMWKAGYELAKKGQITGPAPTDPQERAQWDVERRLPWSVKIKGTWVGLQSLGPAAIPLFIGAQLAEAKRENPAASPVDLAGRGLATAGKVMTEQLYLANVKKLIDAAQDPTKGSVLAAAQVPVPAGLGQIARATDPTVRDAKTVKDRLLARIPGASRLVAPKVDATGRTVTRTPLERAAAVASPFPVSEARESPLLDEMRRLDVTFAMPRRAVVERGVSRPRTPEEFQALLADVGPATERALTTLIADPRYRQASDDVKRRAIERLIGRQATAGRMRERRREATDAQTARGRPR